MVRKILLTLVVLVGIPGGAALGDGGLHHRSGGLLRARGERRQLLVPVAAGLDCELDYTDCVRRKLIGR